MIPIVLFGASGHGNLVIEAVEREARYQIAGFVDSFKPVGKTPYDYDVLGKVEDLPAIITRHGIAGGIVSIGDNWVRYQVVRQVEELAPGFRFVSTIHPSAQVARKVIIGNGVVLMAGAIVNPSCQIEDHCYISTRASLDHDSVMETYSSLGPGAITGGNVRLGAYSTLCLGARVIHGIAVGPHTVIGAGATVLEALPDHVVAYGTPARVVRSRLTGDKYF